MLLNLYKAALDMQRNALPSGYYWALCVGEISDALFEQGVSEKTVNAVLGLAYKNCDYRNPED